MQAHRCTAWHAEPVNPFRHPMASPCCCCSPASQLPTYLHSSPPCLLHQVLDLVWCYLHLLQVLTSKNHLQETYRKREKESGFQHHAVALLCKESNECIDAGQLVWLLSCVCCVTQSPVCSSSMKAAQPAPTTVVSAAGPAHIYMQCQPKLQKQLTDWSSCARWFPPNKCFLIFTCLLLPACAMHLSPKSHSFASMHLLTVLLCRLRSILCCVLRRAVCCAVVSPKS